MASGGPVVHSPADFPYHFSQAPMGPWYSQDAFACRSAYSYHGAAQQVSNYGPFPGQLQYDQRRHFQRPQGYSPEHWIDTRQTPTNFHCIRARPSRYIAPTQPSLQAAVPDAPRGPPRKPKQSGNAIWIGNLPIGANIHEFKDYCSRGATKEIESIFLISKSNCAFANFKSRSACEAAISRIQSSAFRGRRLVCRLRMHSGSSSFSSSSSDATDSPSPTVSTVESVTSPSTPKLIDDDGPVIVQSHSPSTSEFSPEVKKDVDTAGPRISGETAKVPERFFIIKSLTVQDLVASVNNGTWEPQAHNEDTLKNAFSSAENVYLIFSANKSGEYFGLARMTSNIYSKSDEESGATSATTDRFSPIDEPRSLITPANETAPRGRIHDDSARGTIFWEADHALSDNDDGPANEKFVVRKQFNIEWLSTSRVPFFRLRGLRNPWNGLKEVKIARDGTELEPNVGRVVAQSFRSS